MEARPRIKTRERSAILNSLAAGVVPNIGIYHVQVGRKAEVSAVVEDLKRVEDGAAFVRFVVGRYGSGKSFFLNLLRTVALERKLVVARADITTERRLQGSGGKARALFSELMRNLSTRSRPEGGALPNLVERWVSDVVHEVTAAGGSDEDVVTSLHAACKPLQNLVSGYDFAKVIEQYFRGYLAHDEDRQQAALRWLRAEYSTKTQAREELGVRNIIVDKDIYDYLKLIGAFVRIAGYAGLIVCIDELVVLSHRLNHKVARNHNYEAILRILNDCLQGTVEGLGFVFAATDDCLECPRRGLFSYEALATRLQGNRFASEKMIDLSGPVLRLSSLSAEDCFVLLHNIRRVHCQGDESRQVLPDEAIVAYLNDCNRRMGAEYFMTPRDTVKDFVGLLNLLEQNPDANWQSLLGQITTTAEDSRDPSERDVAEDQEEGTSGRDDDLTAFEL